MGTGVTRATVLTQGTRQGTPRRDARQLDGGVGLPSAYAMPDAASSRPHRAALASRRLQQVTGITTGLDITAYANMELWNPTRPPGRCAQGTTRQLEGTWRSSSGPCSLSNNPYLRECKDGLGVLARSARCRVYSTRIRKGREATPRTQQRGRPGGGKGGMTAGRVARTSAADT